MLILAQEKDLRKEDSVENFIVDKDDDVPNVVDTGHGVSDGRIVLNDDIGVDGTVKGGCLYYFLALSILLRFFLGQCQLWLMADFLRTETGPVESKSNSSNSARTVCRADGNHADVSHFISWFCLLD